MARSIANILVHGFSKEDNLNSLCSSVGCVAGHCAYGETDEEITAKLPTLAAFFRGIASELDAGRIPTGGDLERIRDIAKGV